QNNIPANFIWPEGDLPSSSDAEELLKATVVDLKGFFKGDEAETRVAAEFVQEACSSHGFFHVINHGVDPHLIELAQQHMDSFFKLPVSEKLRALTKPGSSSGYSAAHAERFSSTLPWKETLNDEVMFGDNGIASYKLGNRQNGVQKILRRRKVHYEMQLLPALYATKSGAGNRSDNATFQNFINRQLPLPTSFD
ncbi:hypothetical protein F8388_015814, partial [Cannabis sativa]